MQITARDTTLAVPQNKMYMNCSLHDSAGKKQGQELYHIILYHKNQSKVRVPVTYIVQPYFVK